MTTITIEYTLAELPSSQHRAGLAGLVCTLRWLAQQRGRQKGVAEIVSVDARGATFRFDAQGLTELFDRVYRASVGEVEQGAPRKDRNKHSVEPLRTEQRRVVDKHGNEREKTVYVYPTTVPHGACLLDWDPTAKGEQGLWVKLWRDALWAVLRGVPAQRQPYEARANGEATDDATRTWAALLKPDRGAELPSTYYLGAQARSAENVDFRDRNRFLLLLHFWPFVAQIYVPQTVDNDGKASFDPYVIGIPDVAALDAFCDEFPDVMRARDTEAAAFLPRGAVVDIVEEVGLDVMRQLRQRLTAQSARVGYADLILGVDVVHLRKDTNNVRFAAFARLEPGALLDDYTSVRGSYRDVRFRQTRLRALVRSGRWFEGFDRLLATIAYEQTFGRTSFRHDARVAFEREGIMSEESSEFGGETNPPPTMEALIYRVVRAYLSRKLESKYGLAWGKVKDTPREADYNQSRQKLAKDAFLAARSRTEAGDFIEYFIGTLCSVPQSLGEAGFLTLTKHLYERTDDVRTITMLALSALA